MIYNVGADCQTPNLGSIYFDCFGDKTDGVFVEVGAYDGDSISNTSFLADLGWTGYYFEPVPEFARKCSERHLKNKVTVMNNAVGKGGKIKIHVARACSTVFPEENMPCLSQEAGFDVTTWLTGETLEMETIRLDKFLVGNNIKNYDLLVIDVEGMEDEVLDVSGIKTIQPKMIIIELHKKSEAWQTKFHDKTKYCEAVLNHYGYKEVFSNSIDSIFVKQT